MISNKQLDTTKSKLMPLSKSVKFPILNESNLTKSKKNILPSITEASESFMSSKSKFSQQSQNFKQTKQLKFSTPRKVPPLPKLTTKAINNQLKHRRTPNSASTVRSYGSESLHTEVKSVRSLKKPIPRKILKTVLI